MPRGKKNKKRKSRPSHQSLTNQGEIDGIFETAFGHHQRGELVKADALYQRILFIEPNHADALHLSGVISYENKDFSTAESLIKKAISVCSDCAVYHYNMGLVYSEQEYYNRALESFMHAITLQPDHHDAIYRAGLSCHNLKNIESAVAYYEKALELNPDNAEIWNNLGNIATELVRPDDAILYYTRALELNPDFPEAYNNLGTLYSGLNQQEQAIHCFLKALEFLPDFFEALGNLGNSYKKKGDMGKTIECYERSLRINPDCVETLYGLADALVTLGETDRAISLFSEVVQHDPDYGYAWQQLYSIAGARCDWEEKQQYGERLQKVSVGAMNNGTISPESPFSCLERCADTQYIKQVTESWSNEFERVALGFDCTFDFNTREDTQKITLGYYSNNFRNHPNAHLVSGLFELHNRELFTVCCFSYGEDDGSDFRRRIESGCDRFVDIKGFGYVEAAETIYKNGVDILIDLTGYTQGSRMDVCAFRPAPVQVRYLGFPASMQASFFDYIITDKILTPPDMQKEYSEKFVYMPDCYQINDNAQIVSDRVFEREELNLPEDGIVFCSFTTSYKIDPIMFRVWMNLLKNVPGSVLWLLKDNNQMVENLKKEAERCGVDANRLVFADKIPKHEHLARLRLADLALDTRIVGGHLTTSDALWAGVPVITLQGEHFISRASSTILTNIGLPELVTTTIEEYEMLAGQLATDRDKLVQVKKILMEQRMKSSLFDTPRFVRNYEKGLGLMWEQYLSGKAPEQIEIIEDEL